MLANNIPKRKKQTTKSQPKKSQSEDLLNKTTKRKTLNKKLLEVQSRSTLVRSPNHNKQIKSTQNKKDSNKQNKLVKKKKESKQKNYVQFKESDENCDKTLKKFIKKKIDIEQKQIELTQRKKAHLEYFMYKDVCVPVQNTEQRKIIFKIKLIDENVQKQPQKIIQPQTRNLNQSNTSIPLKKLQLVDKAIQPTQRKYNNSDFQCQTQLNELRISENSQSNQQIQKGLAQTLSQLEFLYLPDQKNFSGFSKSEKAHYKELLMYMAKKFQQPQKILLDSQTVELLLNQRYLKQSGQCQSYPKTGIPTHTPAIITYINNFFCYIEIHEKSYLIQRLNCSYGFRMFDKFQKAINQKSTKLNSSLISESTFWKFQNQLYEGLKFQSQIIEQALHSHNKAIFDALNQILAQFQPYYNSQGQPFPWSYNFQTTFFCISDQNFQTLFSQAKDKIYEHSLILAGIYLESQSEYKYKTHINKILTAQNNMLKADAKSYNDNVDMQNSITHLLCQISNVVQMELIKQMVMFLGI